MTEFLHGLAALSMTVAAGAATRCSEASTIAYSTAAQAAARAGHYQVAIQDLNRADALLISCAYDARTGADAQARDRLRLAHNYARLASAYDNLHRAAQARAFAAKALRLFAAIEDNGAYPRAIREEARHNRQLAE